MKAIVLHNGKLSYVEGHPWHMAPNEVPVRVLKAGICETDLQLVRGYMGFQGVPGHEFVGIAESGRFAGQRVVGEINCPCGQCHECAMGLGNHCPRRSVLGILNHDGAFATKVSVPDASLHPIPDQLSDDAAVFVEPVAAACQIPAQLSLREFRRAVVLGDGRLGNLCAQVLKWQQLPPLVIGKHPAKLDRLKKLGLETALLNDVDQGRIADLVIDCTGSSTGFATACRLVTPRGTIVMKTTLAGESGPNLARAVIDELRIIGSRCGPFEMAIEALAGGAVNVETLITSRFRLEQCESAFAAAARPDQFKVVFEMDAEDGC